MELLPLVCLCLLSCSGDAVRVLVKQDSEAVLPCLISNKVDLTGKLFVWKKDGQKEVFTYDASDNYPNRGQDQQFKGRVSHFQDQLQNGNASIKITRTKMADSGNYSCDFPKLEPSQTSIIELVVDQVLKDRTGENIEGAAPEPIIKILKMTKNWILLQCEAHGDPLPTLKWEDSDNNILPAEEPHISEREGRSYITVKTTVTKTDNYSCVATQETLSHQIAAEIPVNIEGAASKPSVTIVRTDEGKVLQCEVLGVSPKPKVEWKDSSGNILPVKDLKETENGDIVLQAAVTKTDNFRCVVTQEGSDSPLSAQIHADVPGWSGWWIVGFIVVSLLLVGAVMFHFKDRISQICAKDPGSTPVATEGKTDDEQRNKMMENQSTP